MMLLTLLYISLASEIRMPASIDDVVPIKGKELRTLIDAPKGKFVILNFWATWCEPCREEFPDLIKFRKEFEGADLAFHFVSVDSESEIPEVRSFLKLVRSSFGTFRKIGSDLEFIQAVDRKWTGALPTTFIFKDGKIRHRYDGPVTYDELKSQWLKLSGSQKKK